MEHDVESETEGHDEERVPEQEGQEGLEHLEDGNGGLDFVLLGRTMKEGRVRALGASAAHFLNIDLQAWSCVDD